MKRLIKWLCLKMNAVDGWMLLGDFFLIGLGICLLVIFILYGG